MLVGSRHPQAVPGQHAQLPNSLSAGHFEGTPCDKRPQNAPITSPPSTHSHQAAHLSAGHVPDLQGDATAVRGGSADDPRPVRRERDLAHPTSVPLHRAPRVADEVSTSIRARLRGAEAVVLAVVRPRSPHLQNTTASEAVKLTGALGLLEGRRCANLPHHPLLTPLSTKTMRDPPAKRPLHPTSINSTPQSCPPRRRSRCSRS